MVTGFNQKNMEPGDSSLLVMCQAVFIHGTGHTGFWAFGQGSTLASLPLDCLLRASMSPPVVTAAFTVVPTVT